MENKRIFYHDSTISFIPESSYNIVYKNRKNKKRVPANKLYKKFCQLYRKLPNNKGYQLI
jgi:hypothetical protein